MGNTRYVWIAVAMLAGGVFSVAFAEQIYSSIGMQITFYVPHNAPGCASSMEGCVATAMPGLDGRKIPRSLDDVREGRAKYVTLASCTNNRYKYYALGKITYRSAEDNQMHTVEDVVGYVHDTGSYFPNGINPQGVHGCRKIDITSTICYKCTSDKQAGAYATGKNVSFLPNGQGLADRQNEQWPGWAGPNPSPGPMQTIAPVGNATGNATQPLQLQQPAQLQQPQSAQPYGLAQPGVSNGLGSALQPPVNLSLGTQPLPKQFSDLLALLSISSSTGAASPVRAVPLVVTDPKDTVALGVPRYQNTDATSSERTAFIPPEMGSNTFTSRDLANDTENRGTFPTFMEPVLTQIKAILFRMIDLLKSL